MGVLFTLTPDILAIAKQSVVDMIEELGKNLLLIYPPKLVTGSVSADPIGNKPPNKWVNGGRFDINSQTNSVLSGGESFVTEEFTEQIKALVAVEPNNFFIKNPPNIQIPQGTIQTKGYIRDLDKILQAKEMILQPEITNIRWKYILDSQPVDVSNIVKGEFIVCQWKRVGG